MGVHEQNRRLRCAVDTTPCLSQPGWQPSVSELPVRGSDDCDPEPLRNELVEDLDDVDGRRGLVSQALFGGYPSRGDSVDQGLVVALVLIGVGAGELGDGPVKHVRAA